MVNRSRWGVCSLALLYVVVGLYYMYRAAVGGQVFNTLLGLLFVAGVIGSAMLLRYLLDAALWRASSGEQLAELSDRLGALDRAVKSLPGLPPDQTIAQRAANGRDRLVGSSRGPHDGGNPAAPSKPDTKALVAASVEQHSFPRLVNESRAATVRERDLSVSSLEVGDGVSPERAANFSSRGPHGSGNPAAQEDEDAARLAHDIPCNLEHWNLYRQWRIALRDEDVCECRRIFSIWRDVESVEIIARRRVELDDLVARVSRDLRDRFVHGVQHRRYADALDVGERILRELPDSRMARDFEAVRPHLQHRVAASASALTQQAVLVDG